MDGTGYARLVEITKSNDRLFAHREHLRRKQRGAIARDDFEAVFEVGKQLRAVDACLRINLGEAAEIVGPDRVPAMSPAIAEPCPN